MLLSFDEFEIDKIFSTHSTSKKRKTQLINSLVLQFQHMDNIIKQIDTAYDEITSVTNIIDNTNNATMDKCKKILIMKNKILAYKIYKNNLKKDDVLQKKKKRSAKNNNNITKKKIKLIKNIKALKEEEDEKIEKFGKVIDDFKQKTIKKGNKGKKGGTKKRVRFKVSRKVYRKLEHK